MTDSPGRVKIPSDVIDDDRLSFRARGVLAFILSQDDDYVVDIRALAGEGREDKEAIGRALRELEAAGYLARNRRQRSNGQWATDCVVYDDPLGSIIQPPDTVKPQRPEIDEASRMAISPNVIGQTFDIPAGSVVYWAYSSVGALLYVGVSDRIRDRLRSHKTRSPWFSRVTRIELVGFTTRAQAEAMEWHEISDRRPLYNVAGMDS